ncbi:L-asparaginase [Hypoxylon sp. FL1150]|nr:L-asparaginase [Hypoxylon sp. FL1150]
MTDSSPYNANLPNVLIFATNGTIAASRARAIRRRATRQGLLGVDILNRLRAAAAERVQPRVVTHGTDTLEKSSFFVVLTIRSEKPVVFVGAMRPATALGADGPIDLPETVTLGADPDAKGRGTMIVLNDRISNAFFIIKIDANPLDIFRSAEQGFLRFFINIKPKFYFSPALPRGKPSTSSSVTKLFKPTLASAVVASGAEGLVMAGMGAGGGTLPGGKVIQEVVENNSTTVVYARRLMDG